MSIYEIWFKHERNDNVECWKKYKKCGSIVLYQAALASKNGTAVLQTGDYIKENRGTAWISEESMQCDGTGLSVEVRSLDDVLKEKETIGVLKIDVKGSELRVLQGMTRRLETHSVRDIIFEESGHFPAPTHLFLQSEGYSIFGLEEGFWRVTCIADAEPRNEPIFSPIRNYLATSEPERAKRSLDRPAWHSFGLLRHLA